MANRNGKNANKKKRDKYKKGKLCPVCGKSKFVGCDQEHKEGHQHHAVCPTCKTCNF